MIYVDNDTIITLAELDLLDLMCAALGVDHHASEVFTLRQAHRVCPLRAGNREVREMILDFLKAVGPVSEHLSRADLPSLQDIENLDGGEALLFACCAGDPNTRCVTGDVKSVRALSENAPDTTLDKLRGRILVTEQVLLKIIDHHGFAMVHGRWTGSACNHGFFGPLVGKPETDVRNTITSRLNDFSGPMRGLCGL